MRIARSTDIEAPPERVYELVMDPHRLHEWVTIHDSLIDAPDGELRRGSELTQCLRLAHRRLKVRWTVVEDECPTRVVWEGRGPVHTHARVIYELEPNGQGTRFSYINEYDLPGGALGRLAGRTLSHMTEREVDATLARLKRLLE
jgi:carbon monoxide dehydrogenase subunit G